MADEDQPKLRDGEERRRGFIIEPEAPRIIRPSVGIVKGLLNGTGLFNAEPVPGVAKEAFDRREYLQKHMITPVRGPYRVVLDESAIIHRETIERLRDLRAWLTLEGPGMAMINWGAPRRRRRSVPRKWDLPFAFETCVSIETRDPAYSYGSSERIYTTCPRCGQRKAGHCKIWLQNHYESAACDLTIEEKDLRLRGYDVCGNGLGVFLMNAGVDVIEGPHHVRTVFTADDPDTLVNAQGRPNNKGISRCLWAPKWAIELYMWLTSRAGPDAGAIRWMDDVRDVGGGLLRGEKRVLVPTAVRNKWRLWFYTIGGLPEPVADPLLLSLAKTQKWDSLVEALRGLPKKGMTTAEVTAALAERCRPLEDADLDAQDEPGILEGVAQIGRRLLARRMGLKGRIDG